MEDPTIAASAYSKICFTFSGVTPEPTRRGNFVLISRVKKPPIK
jgi:hypothetical protein